MRARKIIKHGNEARALLLKGMDSVADVVEKTLGPGGHNILVEQVYYKNYITNDGVRVADNAVNDDALNSIEKVGAKMLVDTLKEEDAEAGDGTTTTAILTRALAHKMLGLANKKGLFSKPIPVMELKRRLEGDAGAVKLLINNEVKKDFKPLDVALVAMENKEHAQKVTDIFKEHGADVSIKIQFNKKNDEVKVITTDGYSWKAGYAHTYFINDMQSMQSTLKNAILYVFNSSIDDIKQYSKVLKKIIEKHPVNPVIIAANKFSDEVISKTLELRYRTGYEIQLVKMHPSKIAERIDDLRVVTDVELNFMEKFDVKKHSHELEEVIIRSNEIIILDGRNKDAVSELANSVKETNPKRFARLTNSIVTILVGSKTYSDTNYLRHKYEDTVNSLRSALKYGVVKGGGMTLLKIDKMLPRDNLFKGILSIPHQVLKDNLGVKTFDVKDNVLDSVKTVLSTIEYTTNTVALLLTTSTVIALSKGQNLDVTEEALDDSEI